MDESRLFSFVNFHATSDALEKQRVLQWPPIKARTYDKLNSIVMTNHLQYGDKINYNLHSTRCIAQLGVLRKTTY